MQVLLQPTETDTQAEKAESRFTGRVEGKCSSDSFISTCDAYGVDFGDRGAFAKLLRQCGEVQGLERVRFMSPHPRDFTDDVINAMAQTKNVMPHLHMPLQSGSDKILQAMRRSYRADRYLGIIEKVRKAMPDAAITTDIIVGFPGESDDDFAATIDLVKQAKFSAAYTFQYSKRPGTPAALMADQIGDDVMAHRYNQLHNIQLTHLRQLICLRVRIFQHLYSQR